MLPLTFKILTLLVALGICSGRNLVLVGGGLSDDNAAIWGKVVELAGGQGAARIGVVTAASGDPLDSATYYIDQFTLYGAAEVYWVPVHLGDTGANSDPTVVSNIHRMTGFFFGGGDQARIIQSFYNNGRDESPALAAIRESFNNGSVVGGTSAGTVAFGSPVMIMGGMSYEALRLGSYASGDQVGSDDLVYDPNGGIGFLDNYVLDSHCSERGREGRLIRLIHDTRGQANGAEFGIGVDEDTALVITDAGTPQAQGTVIGPGGVFIPDLRSATEDTGAPAFRLINVFAAYLTEGDSIHLFNNTVNFAGWKSSLSGREYYDTAISSSDIFNGNRANPNQRPEFVRVAVNLFDSRLDTTTFGQTNERQPRFTVVFFQETFSEGFEGRSPTYDASTIAYQALRLDIEPSQN